MAVLSATPGSGADAIDGVVPRQVAEPDTPEAFAETLALASRDRLQTVITGGRTKADWGRPAPRIDLVIRTSRLNRLIAHRHGDLTVTAQAGLTLEELNRTLRAERQWLPVESAFPGATLGGLIAANDAGPSRHRNGTPRDLVIGMTLALTDGRLVKSGGTVVKNVAGYDLGKLVSSSHGTLAGIVDVTFKLVPMPHASTTLVASYADAAALARDVGILAASQLEPAAFDIRAHMTPGGTSVSLLVRFASSPAATDAQVAQARAMLTGEPQAVDGEREFDLWMAHIREPWQDGATVVRVSWLPDRLPRVLTLIAGLAGDGRASLTLTARAMGTGLLRIEGAAAAAVSAVARLRASADVGHVVVLRAARAVKDAVDVWGAPLDTDPVARALKQMFDPAGILNAGRGPV